MIPCFFVQSILGDLHLYLFVFILLGYDFLDVDAMGLHRVYIDVACIYRCGTLFLSFWKGYFYTLG